jgi:pimeloyl-ACP methyl ester carboxylesterase
MEADVLTDKKTAATQFIQVGANRLAYRRLGQPSDFPLLLLNFFAAAMDDWDPKVTNGLAAGREVILFNSVGVASSTGKAPSTVAAMAKDCLEFCNALDLKKMDILGFSLGGMIAQQLAFQQPGLVRRMILVGTGPMGGEGLTFSEALLDDLKDPAALIMRSFFTPSDLSQAAGRDYLKRLQLRKADRDAAVSLETAGAQLHAIREWGVVPSSDRYAMLRKIPQPALVVHGNKDVVVNPINAFLLGQQLPDAQLVMYPDASHGVASQHADFFLPNARLFLAA